MYGTKVGAAAYHTARGNSRWAALSDDEEAQARQRASDYIDAVYGLRFPGRKAGGAAQWEAWPRTGASDYYNNEIADDVVPVAIEYATYELALRSVETPGILNPGFSADRRKVLTEVQGIKWTLLKGSSDSSQLWPEFPLIEGFLRPYLTAYPSLPAILVV